MRDMTPEERHAFYRTDQCPGCGEWRFLLGPTGGLMVNVQCEGCGLRLNVVQDGFLDVVGEVLHEPAGYQQRFGFPE
jgi:hypothetical protein